MKLKNENNMLNENQKSARSWTLILSQLNGGYISKDKIDQLHLSQDEVETFRAARASLNGGFGFLALAGIFVAQYAGFHLLDRFVADPLDKLINGDQSAIPQLLEKLHELRRNQDENAEKIINHVTRVMSNHQLVMMELFNALLTRMDSLHIQQRASVYNRIDFAVAQLRFVTKIDNIFAASNQLFNAQSIYGCNSKTYRDVLKDNFQITTREIEVVLAADNVRHLLDTSKRCHSLFHAETLRRELVATMNIGMAIELLYIQMHSISFNQRELRRKYKDFHHNIKRAVDHVYGTGKAHSLINLAVEIPDTSIQNYFALMSEKYLSSYIQHFDEWKERNRDKQSKYESKPLLEEIYIHEECFLKPIGDKGCTIS